MLVACGWTFKTVLSFTQVVGTLNDCSNSASNLNLNLQSRTLIDLIMWTQLCVPCVCNGLYAFLIPKCLVLGVPNLTV